MAHHQRPTADNVLLAYLVGVLSVVAAFTTFMYWLMSPTVLPNAVFEIETHAVVSLTPLSSLRAAEKAAIALAMEENEKQGIRPVAVADHDPPAASARKIATASRAKPTKPKRAARAQDLYQARNSWAFAPSRTEYNPFGGFGTWFR